MRTNNDFILIGEKTSYKQDEDCFYLNQNVKYHLTLTTVLIGGTLWLWFKSWLIAVPIICIGITELFIIINIVIDRKMNSVEKSLSLGKYKIWTLYRLDCYSDYELIEYKSGRGADGLTSSFEVGFEKGFKTYELLSFSDLNVRHQLCNAITAFIKRNDD